MLQKKKKSSNIRKYYYYSNILFPCSYQNLFPPRCSEVSSDAHVTHVKIFFVLDESIAQRAAAPFGENTKSKRTTITLHMAEKKKKHANLCLLPCHFQFQFGFAWYYNFPRGPDTVSPPHVYTVFLICVIVYNVSRLLPFSLFSATFWS